MRSKRQRIQPTHEWAQIQLLVPEGFPEQLVYEVIRYPLLFGQPVSERARETGTPQGIMYRQIDRFEQEGMLSLFASPKVEKHQQLPEEIRTEILMLKAEHPAFRTNEIATICYAKFNRRPSPRTIKRILAEKPVLVGKADSVRRYLPYHEIEGAYERRRAVVDLHSQGWNVKSIAEYMRIDRNTVYAILKRWVAEGPAGLEDKSSAPHDHARKVDLRAITEVSRLQKNPYIGAFRIHAALEELGIHLSRATCGRIMAMNRKLYGLPKPEPQQRQPKPMPFTPSRRHEYWFTDIRYIDNDHLGYRVYCITVLEGFSRLVLYSTLSRTQTSLDYLRVLHSAIRQYGVPEQLVSDSGGQFLSNEAKRIYREVEITKRQIEKGQAWQDLLEANFGTQRRMSDFAFSEARTWEELLRVHDEWVWDFNHQPHFAHQKREDGKRSPAAVLSWVRGREVESQKLDRVFRGIRYERTLDRLGYATLHRWKVYGEEGLSGERTSVWLSEDTLAVEYADETLAIYKIKYRPDHKHLIDVAEPQLFQTPHHPPQLRLWEMGDDEWLKTFRLPDYAPRSKHVLDGEQTLLFEYDLGYEARNG